MRVSITTIFIMMLFMSFANDGEERNEVWIDGSSFYKSISHKKKSTIYFKEWSAFVQQFLEDDSYFVALQLDSSFDPAAFLVVSEPAGVGEFAGVIIQG